MSMDSASSGSSGPGESRNAAPGSAPGSLHRDGPLGAPSGLPRSPLDWARKRLAGRSQRRLTAAEQRAEQRLGQLGPAWRVVEWPASEDVLADQERTGFLVIGPGGVYAVTVVDQGRQRVMLAGDVVQIRGRRPPYVSRARKGARKASDALTAVVGSKVPVVPVLTFVGSGTISAQGLPSGCLVVAHRELDRLLRAAGNKISAATAKKLADVASHPATWADRYRWYPDDQTASDNRTAQR